MDILLSAALFALACNLDTLILAVGYGLNDRPLGKKKRWYFRGLPQ